MSDAAERCLGIGAVAKEIRAQGQAIRSLTGMPRLVKALLRPAEMVQVAMEPAQAVHRVLRDLPSRR